MEMKNIIRVAIIKRQLKKFNFDARLCFAGRYWGWVFSIGGRKYLHGGKEYFKFLKEASDTLPDDASNVRLADAATGSLIADAPSDGKIEPPRYHFYSSGEGWERSRELVKRWETCSMCGEIYPVYWNEKRQQLSEQGCH
jgi:hypothetical protein